MAHDETAMSAILYPVAASAEEALGAPRGRAARERDAQRLADADVRFVSEETGPAFATRDAALDAYPGRLDDERIGAAGMIAPEDRFCLLRERAPAPPAPLEPAMRDGRRWARGPSKKLKTSFRLTVSYWKIGAGEAPQVATPQARDLRRKAGAAKLDAGQLRALADQPLRPVRPQQPLEVGLFEVPAPEAPHILIPDE
jgi:hypothetical protein